MRFKRGSKVEVLQKKDTPSGSWQCAEIISGNGHNYTVRYEGLGEATVVERVTRKDIRPSPPPLEVSADWVSGDLVEVFHNSSWKLATISKVMGKKQFWQDDQWTVIGKGSRNYDNGKHDEFLNLKDNQNSSFQIQKTKTRINPRVNGHCVPVTNKFSFQESHFASSRPLKRSPPYCSSQVDAYAGTLQKFRVIENEGRCHQVFTSNPSLLTEQVDVAPPRVMLGEKEALASAPFKIRTTTFPEAECGIKKPSGLRHSFEVNIQSDNADSLACSVGSCSINIYNSGTLSPHVSSSPVKDLDCLDAKSCCPVRYEERCCLHPTKEELAAEIYRLELHAYHCIMEALHASGSFKLGTRRIDD